MDKDTMIILALIGGLWLWGRRKGATQVQGAAVESTNSTPSTAIDAEGWMGAWGVSK